MQGAGGSPRLWRLPEDSLPTFGDAGLTTSRSKFLFLIRRWRNQVQTLFLYNPFLSQFCFLHEPLGFKSFLKSPHGLTADVQLPMASSWGEGSCLTHLPLLEGSQQSQRSPRMLSPFPPDLNAVSRAQRPCWFLLQKLSLAMFGGATRIQSIHSKCFHKLSSHLWSYLHVLPYLICNHQLLVKG